MPLGLAAGSAVLLALLLDKVLPQPAVEYPSEVLPLFLLSLAFFPVFYAALAFFGQARLQRKLISAFLLISLLPVSLLALLDQRATSQALSENSRQAMLNAAFRTAASLDNFILANLATVRTEAMIPQFADFLTPSPDPSDASRKEREVMSLLSSLKRRDQTNITSLALLDNRGVSVADTYGPDIGANKADRDYYLEPLRTGLPHASPVSFGTPEGQPALHFSCPVRNTQGSIVGVLRVRYKASVLQQLLRADTGSGAETYSAALFDETGIRLADSRRPDLISTPAFPLPQRQLETLHAQRRLQRLPHTGLLSGLPLQALDKDAAPFFRASLYGPTDAPTLNVKTRLQSKPWTLVLSYFESADLARMQSQSLNALTMVLVVVTAVTIGALLITRHVTKPLLRLTAAAEAISKGREDVFVPLGSRDEVGELAATFNAMSEALLLSRQHLTASSERLQSLLHTLPDAVLVHGEAGEILDVNRSFSTMFGYTPDEARHLGLGVLSGGGLTTSDARQRLGTCIASGACEFEWVSRRKDQSEFPSYVRLRKLDLPEGIRILAVVSDDTLKKQAERDMREAREDLERKVAERTRELREANEQLQQLDALKSSFISLVSHELRTPLTSVLGFAKLTGKTFRKHFLPLTAHDAELDRRGQVVMKNLQVIEGEGARLARLVNDLLDINKIESGKSVWNDVRLRLEEELQAAVQTMRSEIAEHPRVRVQLDLDPATPDLLADRDRIRQLFLNLLSNAMKFTTEGFIRITTATLPAGDAVEVRVQDSGRGIAPEDLERIFDKFYQVSLPDKDLAKSKGTGLGLTICRQIVEHYGGTIRAESKLGRGSTFICTLPVPSEDTKGSDSPVT